jgi:hypothetical protein
MKYEYSSDGFRIPCENMDRLNEALSSFGASDMARQLPGGWNDARIEVNKGGGYSFCVPCPEACDKESCQHFRNQLFVRGWEQEEKKKMTKPSTPKVSAKGNEPPSVE